MHNSETEEHYRKRKYLKNSNSGGGGEDYLPNNGHLTDGRLLQNNTSSCKI